MRLRSVIAAAVIGVLAVGMAGCGSNDAATPSDPTKLSGSVTMWVYPINEKIENTWWKPQVAVFQKKYPNINVDVVVQPWANRDQQLTTAIAGNKGPDVVYLIPDQLSQYASQGVLADVSGAITEKNDFRPNTLQALTYNNTLYGVPILMSVTTTMVNKKVLQAAGITDVPKTWDDILADAPKIKAAGYYVTDWVAAPEQSLNQTWYPLLWEAGGDVLSADGKKATFNNQAGLDALTLVKKLVDGGYTPKDSLSATPKADQSVTCQGKAAMTLFQAPSTVTTCPGVNLDDWEVGPPLKNKKSISYGTVGGLSVLEGSKNKDAAKAWIGWLTSADQMKTFDKDHVFSSPRTSVGAVFAGQPITGDAEKHLDEMKFGVINSHSRQLMALIVPHLQAALLGKEQPQAALDAAAKDVNDLLARNG